MKRALLLFITMLCEAPAEELFDETTATTLFAFDRQAIPFTQNLKLVMQKPRKHEANPILARGQPGTPDAQGVQFYGSILRDGERYRMWYVAFDDDTPNRQPSTRWRAAYAESTDGVHWSRPHLGLVDYRGNKNNNLLDMGGQAWGFVNLKVIRDEDEADPNRRYKMTTHVYYRHTRRLGTLLTWFSQDGFRWQPSKPVKPTRGELSANDLLIPGFHFEPCGGLYQWQGQYFIMGQNALPGTHHHQGRVCRVYRSHDFMEWQPTNTVSFTRITQEQWLGPGRSLEGEQCHEGISVWNRGHVLLGIYGQWHGAPTWKDISVDLGLVISHDGLFFHEPKTEWCFLKHGDKGSWDQGGLLQGQGFQNIGENTYIYYGAWDPTVTGGPETPRGGVGIALLPRDRFGYLSFDDSNEGPGDYQLPQTQAQLVTSAQKVKNPEFYLNAEGLDSEAWIRVELLDSEERPIPQCSGTKALLVKHSGFHIPLVWPQASELPEQVRFRLTLEGKHRSQIKFSALYLREKTASQPRSR